MATETHPKPTAPAARRRTRPVPETQPDTPPVERSKTGERPHTSRSTKRNNPPIKRRDGSYRPLDLDLVDRLVKNFREDLRKNPEYHKMMQEQSEEFGNILPL